MTEPPPGTTLGELLTHYLDYLKEGSWSIATSGLEAGDPLPDRVATDAIVDRLAERMLDRSRFDRMFPLDDWIASLKDEP
jgi:hypothetical protein